MAVKSSRSYQWQQQRLRVLNRDGWECHYCHGAATQADHVIAKVNGGDDSLENLVSCCRMCNLRKGRKPQGVFLGVTPTPLSSPRNIHMETTSPDLVGPFEGQSRPLWS